MLRALRLTVLLVTLVAALTGGGCGTTTGPAGTAAQRRNPVPGDAQLAATVRPGDSLSVQLQSIPDAGEFKAQVDDTGYINLRYIGRVKAAGLTPSELAQRVHDAYIDQHFYKTIDVSVAVAERYVYVGGEVQRPGRVLWTPDLTLTSAITAAGGFSPYARETAVILSREDSSYTMDAKLAARTPTEDAFLIPGDRITVPKSAF